MIKKILAAMLALFAAAAFAAVDANTATQAELEAVKGIGPSISSKIIEERKKAPFKDWQDMVTRVKGVGETNSAKFSTAGLTVNGAAFAGAPAAPAKKEEKKAAPAATPAPAPAAPAKAEAKAPAAAASTAAMSAADKKAAKKKEREDKKAAKSASAAPAASAAASGAKK